LTLFGGQDRLVLVSVIRGIVTGSIGLRLFLVSCGLSRLATGRVMGVGWIGWVKARGIAGWRTLGAGMDGYGQFVLRVFVRKLGFATFWDLFFWKVKIINIPTQLLILFI